MGYRMPGHLTALRPLNIGEVVFYLRKAQSEPSVSLQKGREWEGVSCYLLSPVILRAKDRVI